MRRLVGGAVVTAAVLFSLLFGGMAYGAACTKDTDKLATDGVIKGSVVVATAAAGDCCFDTKDYSYISYVADLTTGTVDYDILGSIDGVYGALTPTALTADSANVILAPWEQVCIRVNTCTSCSVTFKLKVQRQKTKEGR